MRLTPEQIETLKKVRESGGSVREAAKAANVAPSTAARLFPDPVRDRTIKEDGDDATVEYLSPKRIKTLEDAMEFGEVDPAIWIVDRWECTSWEVVTRVRQGQDADKRWLPDRVERHQMWRVRLYLKRIVPRAMIEARKRLCEALPVQSLLSLPPRMPKGNGRAVMCALDLYDCHFGKLCWDKECGTDYDLKIAQSVFRHAVEDLLDYVLDFNIEEFLVPIGNDFLHIDNLINQTTGGTVVDTDGRFPKIYTAAKLAVIEMVEYLICFAPVRLVRVPGNHDRLSSWFLCDALSERFRTTDMVTVDTSPASRKYHKYGCNLIGLIHGDKVPGDGIKVLPTIMASEKRDVWGEITNPEWHLGHKHTQRKFSTRDMDTMNGVVVRWLASLSATDAWHFDNLYVGNKRAAELFIYDKERGNVGSFTALARTG